jgi:bacillithiol system protein YtxJ
MNGWIALTSPEHLVDVRERSFLKPQLVFKHSIWCGTSAHIHDILHDATSSLREKGLELNFLDLINHRPVSNQVAEDFGVVHQSPQVILIHEGKAVYNASHYSIDPKRIISAIPA